MKKRLLAALMAGAMALTMTACGGSSSGSDDSNAASGSCCYRFYRIHCLLKNKTEE